jgi:hypothetical protein
MVSKSFHSVTAKFNDWVGFTELELDDKADLAFYVKT